MQNIEAKETRQCTHVDLLDALCFKIFMNINVQLAKNSHAITTSSFVAKTVKMKHLEIRQLD